MQLESFFDPELVNFLNISEDPIPYYRQLMKDYSSGYLRVPVVGAGTANTEFETISGMSSGISERVSIRTNRCFQRRRVRVRRMF